VVSDFLDIVSEAFPFLRRKIQEARVHSVEYRVLPAHCLLDSNLARCSTCCFGPPMHGTKGGVEC